MAQNLGIQQDVSYKICDHQVHQGEIYRQKQTFNILKRCVYEIARFFGIELWGGEQLAQDIVVVQTRIPDKIQVSFKVTPEGTKLVENE